MLGNRQSKPRAKHIHDIMTKKANASGPHKVRRKEVDDKESRAQIKEFLKNRNHWY